MCVRIQYPAHPGNSYTDLQIYSKSEKSAPSVICIFNKKCIINTEKRHILFLNYIKLEFDKLTV